MSLPRGVVPTSSSLPLNVADPTPIVRRSARLFLPAAAGFFFCAIALTDGAISPDSTAPGSSGTTIPENEMAPASQPELAAPLPASSDTTVQLNGRTVAETPRRFKYSFGLSARGVYDDNINISPTNRVSAYYTSIEPFITLGLGDPGDGFNSLSFVYRPSIFLYIDHSANNSVQHIIHLDAQRRFSRLSISLAQDVQLLDGANLNSLSDPTGHEANIDVGGRVKHQIYTSSLNLAYDLTGKIFLSLGGNFAADEYQTQISSQYYSGNAFLNYRYSDKVVLGVGGTGGLNTVDNSLGTTSDQTFQQANLRLSYVVTEKISLNASGGVEFRQFGSGGSGNHLSPVYELSASYQPFDGTTFTLSGTRHTSNSAVLAGQDFAESKVSLAVAQRLVRRVTASLALGYENNDYFSTVQGLSATRTDNYYYVQPAVDVSITRFWTVGAYYLYRHDDSSVQQFQFHNEQVGVRTSLVF